MPQRHIIGHDLQRERLAKICAKELLPSALAFSGPNGVGKLLVALEVAKTLLCEASSEFGGCSECKACKIFENRNHPDFHMFECADREISKMENVRELLHHLNLKSFSGSNRVIILNDAEYLSLQATNALLKSFEEPRPGTYFFLVTANHSRLPATLMSRCQLWFFDTLSKGQIAGILTEQPECFKNLDLSDLGIKPEELALLADGSLDSIESITEGLDDWREIALALDQIANGDLNTGIELSKEYARDKQKIAARLDLMRIHARRRMSESEDASHQMKWSVFITNLLSAERLILERNLAIAYCLNNCFIQLSSDSFTLLGKDDRLLSHITI